MGTAQFEGLRTTKQEAQYYQSLSREQQREHRIRLHAYYLSCRAKNSGKTLVENWLQAEVELGLTDIEILFAKVIRNSLAGLLKVPVESIRDATELPPDYMLLHSLYALIALAMNMHFFIVNGKSRTVGALILELCQRQEQSQGERHRHLW